MRAENYRLEKVVLDKIASNISFFRTGLVTDSTHFPRLNSQRSKHVITSIFLSWFYYLWFDQLFHVVIKKIHRAFNGLYIFYLCSLRVSVLRHSVFRTHFLTRLVEECVIFGKNLCRKKLITMFFNMLLIMFVRKHFKNSKLISQIVLEIKKTSFNLVYFFLQFFCRYLAHANLTEMGLFITDWIISGSSLCSCLRVLLYPLIMGIYALLFWYKQIYFINWKYISKSKFPYIL